MAILFDKERSKYIEILLFPLADPEWITYKMCGGYANEKIELFRLDNGELFFHNAYYEKEVEDLLNNLSSIKKIHHYTFTPIDEGEFRLIADYKEGSVSIKFIFRVLDKMNAVDMKNMVFNIVTTESLLYNFLIELKKNYLNIV